MCASWSIRPRALPTAKALLRDPRLGVRAIARQVGYATESAFINTFRRLTGASPLEYRDAIARREGLAS